MNKIIILISLIVSIFTLSANPLIANVETKITENIFHLTGKVFIENEDEIIVGNTPANQIDNKYLIDGYNAGKTIIMFSQDGYLYDIFYGEEFFNNQIVIYKLINNQKYVCSYSTKSNDVDVFDIELSMWDFYLDKTAIINELKNSQEIITIINPAYYTSKELGVDGLDIESFLWTQQYYQQKTVDFAPYGKTESTITGYKCTIDTTDYWVLKVVNEYHVGKELQNNPITGNNYYPSASFSDNEDRPVVMAHLRIYRRSQYIGSNMYIYGGYPKHGLYFPTNSTTEIPYWNGSQSGTIDSEGYLSYFWTSNNFEEDNDITDQVIVKEFGAMFSVETTEAINGLYIDLYVFTKFEYLGIDINKAITHYRVLLT